MSCCWAAGRRVSSEAIITLALDREAAAEFGGHALRALGHANGTFTTVGPMVLWRASHTSTLITTGPQAGQVLIAGGYGDYPALAASTEFFDPGTSAFTSGPVMTSVRAVTPPPRC